MHGNEHTDSTRQVKPDQSSPLDTSIRIPEPDSSATLLRIATAMERMAQSIELIAVSAARPRRGELMELSEFYGGKHTAAIWKEHGLPVHRPGTKADLVFVDDAMEFLKTFDPENPKVPKNALESNAKPARTRKKKAK